MLNPTHRQYLLYAAAAVAVLALGWSYAPGQSGASMPDRSVDRPYTAASQTAPVDVAAGAAGVVVVVDVAGAVRHPGVYRLAAGARVQDAVRRAGVGPHADLAAVNLAARLTDGEQVVVPVHGQAAAAAGGAGTASPAAPVSLNSGTLAQLETLDGVGPSLAQRIIDYRTLHGGFRSLAELDQVSGFGPARLAALRGKITL